MVQIVLFIFQATSLSQTEHDSISSKPDRQKANKFKVLVQEDHNLKIR